MSKDKPKTKPKFKTKVKDKNRGEDIEQADMVAGSKRKSDGYGHVHVHGRGHGQELRDGKKGWEWLCCKVCYTFFWQSRWIVDPVVGD